MTAGQEVMRMVWLHDVCAGMLFGLKAKVESAADCEEKLFSENLLPYTGGATYSVPIIPINDDIPIQAMKQPINRALENLLVRVKAEGWEPAEPIDPDYLWARKRIPCRNRWSSPPNSHS